MACKGKAGDSAELQNRKAIYAFDLNKKALNTTPILTIGQPEVQKYLQAHAREARLEKVIEFFANPNEFEFSPSSVAVHPLNGNLYLLSAVGNIFMVINFQGEVVYLEKLKGKVQPMVFGETTAKRLPHAPAMTPVFLHLGIVLMLGLYIPPYLTRWFHEAARMLG